MIRNVYSIKVDVLYLCREICQNSSDRSLSSSYVTSCVKASKGHHMRAFRISISEAYSAFFLDITIYFLKGRQFILEG